jgi:hypothetical protein
VEDQRRLEEMVATGEISADEYRERVDKTRRVHIPVSAAWEDPSGEMTQLVGMEDATTVVPAEDPTQKIAIEDIVGTDPPR